MKAIHQSAHHKIGTSSIGMAANIIAPLWLANIIAPLWLYNSKRGLSRLTTSKQCLSLPACSSSSIFPSPRNANLGVPASMPALVGV